MIKKNCILTGVEFKSDDPDENIAPNIIENVVHCIKNNPKARQEVLSAALRDSECLKIVAQAVMSCKMSDIGLSYPGTVAEFFCRISDKKGSKKSRKSSK